MATTTYNFVGVTVPAGATSHKGTYGSAAGTPASPPPNPPAGSEGTQTNIDNIESSNDVRWTSTPGFNEYAYKIFRWYDPTSGTITQYTAKAEGYDSAAAGRIYRLFIWNFNTSAWEFLAQHGNASDTTITGSVTSNLANYRDGNNYVYTATRQCGLGGQLNDDYVELTVTYTPAAAAGGFAMMI